jgi:hypothetical protein
MGTLEHYYLSEEISDLRFLVHDEERAHEHSLHAHSFVLHMKSAYWQRMLASGLREATESRIRIDAAVESVKLVLHFICTGKVMFPARVEHVVETAYLAGLYELQELKDLCVGYLTRLLNDKIQRTLQECLSCSR